MCGINYLHKASCSVAVTDMADFLFVIPAALMPHPMTASVRMARPSFTK